MTVFSQTQYNKNEGSQEKLETLYNNNNNNIQKQQ